MPNRALFPIRNTNPNVKRDFVGAGGARGWVPCNGTETIKEVAKAIFGDTTASAGHAIPSPIAHLKDFKARLDAGMPDAVNAWRGMLAVIAMQYSLGIEIEIKRISIDAATGKAPTLLAQVIRDTLIQNSAITGYTENDQWIYCFCKKTSAAASKAFAMYLPTIGLFPFKQYDADLFEGVPWYSAENGKPEWKDLLNCGYPWFHDAAGLVTTQGRKLLFWLRDHYQALCRVNQNVANRYDSLVSFINDLSPNFLNANQQPVKGETDVITAPYSQNAPNGFGTIARAPGSTAGKPVSRISFFSDNLLVLISLQKDAVRLEHDNQHFVPFPGETAAKKQFYIVPPIHTDLVGSIKDGVQLLNWQSIWNQDKKIFNVEIELNYPQTAEKIKCCHRFTVGTDVIYTDTMPYLSLWPRVHFPDDSWNMHLVTALYEYTGIGVLTKDDTNYSEFQTPGNSNRVVGDNTNSDFQGFDNLQIRVIPRTQDGNTVTQYSCTSPFRAATVTNDVKFDTFVSTSEPYALSFACDRGSLGCWIIDLKDVKRVDVQNDQPLVVPKQNSVKKYIVAIDFGTTSTNVYLNGDGALKSITSPGYFLLDLYNPYQVDSYEFNRRYYLFAADDGPLGKFFTYAQNFNATDVVSRKAFQDTLPHVSGRFLDVDEQFIAMSVAGGAQGGLQGVEYGLKWAEDDLNKTHARKNLLFDALMCAIMEAKSYGAREISLNVSYPDEHFGQLAKTDIEAMLPTLRKQSGFSAETQLYSRYNTEAACAGLYFLNNYPKEDDRPVATQGFAIVDIGGGTTDYSLWQDDNTKPVNEHSYGYAGGYLVERTIIQSVRNNETAFSDMWNIGDSSTIGKRSRDAYIKFAKELFPVEEAEPNPLGDTTNNDNYQKCAAALAFILDKCGADFGALLYNLPIYANMLQAMRMKYYALFDLLAKHISEQIRNGAFQLRGNFRVCLAGCGSKGMDFCTVDPTIRFDDNIKSIFTDAMGAAGVPHFTLEFAHPLNSKKEEVVIGLTQIPNNPAGAATAAPNANPANPPQPADPTVDEAREAYSGLINRIKAWEGVNADDVHLVNRLSIDGHIASEHFDKIIHQSIVAARKANPDPSVDTFKELVTLFALEKMIDKFI